jgi:oxygen-independent coproporphyrinogen-3 oxidase
MTGPIGLYVHFPFCRARCHYCAFYFVVGRRDARDRYVASLEAEIRSTASDPRFRGRAVESVYFGGGTPSLLSPAQLGRVAGAVRASFPVAAGCEVSLEANPDGLSAESAAAWREKGCNRVTLGWQSMRDANLRALTRTHGREDNVRALDIVRRAGFENVGVDLIFGLPGQAPSDWRAELEEVARLAPDHVSAYELTLEEGTRFLARSRAGRLALPDEGARAAMFEETEEVLSKAGILRYEISNFARPGKECRHNLAGWRSGDLLGVGASAASHVGNARWTNAADLDEYVARIESGRTAALEAEVLDEVTWAAEDLYLGLRVSDGLDAGERLERVSGPGRDRLAAVLERAEGRGLLERRARTTRLTRKGLLLADSVFAELLVP